MPLKSVVVNSLVIIKEMQFQSLKKKKNTYRNQNEVSPVLFWRGRGQRREGKKAGLNRKMVLLAKAFFQKQIGGYEVLKTFILSNSLNTLLTILFTWLIYWANSVPVYGMSNNCSQTLFDSRRGVWSRERSRELAAPLLVGGRAGSGPHWVSSAYKAARPWPCCRGRVHVFLALSHGWSTWKGPRSVKGREQWMTSNCHFMLWGKPDSEIQRAQPSDPHISLGRH